MHRAVKWLGINSKTVFDHLIIWIERLKQKSIHVIRINRVLIKTKKSHINWYAGFRKDAHENNS